ncbi:MAG: DUF456 domain-containing protein [Alistipes sp.]|nr:DUF456 domain-containing protein [Candidatus Alistipes equi]
MTLLIVAYILFAIGIIGCVLPIIPGQIIAFVALVCAYFSDTSTISQTSVIVFAFLTLVVTLMDYFLPPLLTKLSGGSKAGQRGAFIGMIVGLFLGPIGIIFGSAIGAFIGEKFGERRDEATAIRSALASFLAFLLTTGLKLALTIWMLLHLICH